MLRSGYITVVRSTDDELLATTHASLDLHQHEDESFTATIGGFEYPVAFIDGSPAAVIRVHGESVAAEIGDLETGDTITFVVTPCDQNLVRPL